MERFLKISLGVINIFKPDFIRKKKTLPLQSMAKELCYVSSLENIVCSSQNYICHKCVLGLISWPLLVLIRRKFCNESMNECLPESVH